MKLSLRIPLLLLLFVLQMCAGATCFATDSKPTPTTQQWEQLTSDKAFGYRDEKEGITKRNPDKENAMWVFLGAIAAFFASGIGNAILWIALFLFAAWALYKIFFNSDTFIWAKKDRQISEAVPDEMEDLESTNWNLQLQKAMQANDVRLSIRYSYMLLLQMMQQKGLIQYRPDKTNYEYYHELNDTYKQDFRILTRQYEYAWYGNFEVAEENYRKYMDTFNQMKKTL